ncbi:MAG: ATP-binding protein [Pseudomonas sp.]|nr:ATP-binding protein [Pseudomonas sp.]
MIYSFGARNFYSFREGMRVSFELNSKVPKSISKGAKVSNVLGVKGANASGKTNILKCLNFLASFISESFKWDSERDPIDYISFFCNDEPSDVYIDFEVEGVRYIYEAEFTMQRVLRETLYRKVSRRTKIYERVGDEIKYRSAEYSVLDIIVPKSTASLISTFVMYKFKGQGVGDELRSIHSYFSSFRSNVFSVGVHGDDVFTRELASKYYAEYPDALDFVSDLIKRCDIGISSIELHESQSPEKGEDEKDYMPFFTHDVESVPAGQRWLTAWDQSSGTMALYRHLVMYWEVLQVGGVLIMDEFDIHCHSMVLPVLVNLFDDPIINPHSAQFIFTAHSSAIMDHLGKYRTILVGKTKGESFCYRLDEIPGDLIRNDRSISALYREGKIGGVPKIDG